VKPATAKSALEVQALLGDDFQVLEFDASTRTAAEAAAAIGCTVSQIAKSLIFRAVESRRPVLVIASGKVRADESRVCEILGEEIARADADFVRKNTGYSIGGVPPLGHRNRPVVFIDKSLFEFDEIWAAAGTPNAVFRLRPDDLVRLTGGTVANIAG